MGDLILRTRLSITRRNLLEVMEVVNAVQERRQDVARLVSLSKAMSRVLTRIDNAATSAGNLLNQDEVSEDDLVEVERHLGEVTGQVAALRAQLADAEPHLSAVEDRLQVAAIEEPRKHMAGGLVEEASTRLKALDGVEGRLDAGADGTESLTHAWAELLDEDRLLARIFNEYVDFLGGVALRDAGLDGGICLTADELLRAYSVGDFTWNSLTIPARQEALDATLARVIRLGFPEWTLWALPLTAHELGHVFVTSHHETRALLDRAESGERYTFQLLLADAFATYAMGPAYACASILMRLEPAGGAQGRVTAQRAGVILAALGRMNVARSVERPYSGIIETLTTEWADACAQAGGEAALDESEKDLVRQVVSVLAKAFGAYVTLSPSAWGRIRELADKLLAGPVEDVQLRADDELRYVLNAAWIDRLGHPEQAAALRTNADSLLQKLRMLQPGTGRTSGRRAVSSQRARQAVPTDKPAPRPYADTR